MKALGVFAVLSCLAFVGARAKDEEAYGHPVPVELRAPSAERVVEPPPQLANKDAEVPPSSNTSGAKPPPCTEAPAITKPSAILPDGRIVLNEASEQEFNHLPGVGDARAKAMFELREKLGGFKKVTDLLRIKGIGPRTLQKLKDLVVLDRPEEAGEPPVASGSAPPAQGS